MRRRAWRLPKNRGNGRHRRPTASGFAAPIATARCATRETATPVEHRTGVPVASLSFHDQNGELAAVGALLEVVPISGPVITLDALHTTRDTTVSIVEQHDADYLLTVKGNCSETFEALATMPREDATGRFSEDPQKGRGRIDRRHIERTVGLLAGQPCDL